MTTNRRSAGGPALRATAPRSWMRPPRLGLLALALIGLAQGGCRSDGCGNCNIGSKLTSGFNNGVAAVGRVFRHDNKGGGCKTCGDGGGEEGMIIEGAPMAAPGGIVMPGPGTIVPAPSIESAPSQLEALPTNPTSGTGASGTTSGGRAASPTSTRGGSVNSRSGYEAYVPRGGLGSRRSSDLARALHSTPDPDARTDDSGQSSNLFDKIPPVDLPAELTRKATSPTPTTAPAPVPVSANPVAPTAAENHSAGEGGAIAALASTPQSPGIRRSASVAPTLGGGSVPSVEGLEWLKEKGYKTFVDLRQGSEVEPTFADAVNDRGMVYISLPIMASRLEPTRLARFDDLIAQSENRPLYFSDADGTRAGLVWYIHLRAVDGEDSRSAAQKAEEVGLTDAQLKLADAYLTVHKPKARPKVAMAPPQPAAPESGAVLPPEPPPAPPVATAAEVAKIPMPALPDGSSDLPEPPIQVPASSDSPPLPMLPGEGRPQASTIPFRDPATWRPLAALVLTGVGVPLAYWSRSAISVARSSARRASLPGPGRRSLEAPPSSDA